MIEYYNSNNFKKFYKSCRVCNSKEIKFVFRLKKTPFEDHFVKKNKINVVQHLHPLDLYLCRKCGYFHLAHILSPKASYTHYLYQSEVTINLKNHYDQFANYINNKLKNNRKNKLIVDIGSNDGTLLSAFKKKGYKVVGVEPAKKISSLANKKFIKTYNCFFNTKIVKKILKIHGVPNIITANYVYANIENIIQFTKDVKSLMDEKSIFVIQTGYHPEQMKIKMFDYIYHEHFSYFSVNVISKILQICGLKILDVKKIKPKGGSIRIISALPENKKVISKYAINLIKWEKKCGIHQVFYYKKFYKQIEKSKDNLLKKLKILRDKKISIVGFGASHSTTVLIYHFELKKYLKYLVDDNKLKHGLYSPGYHIPVYPISKLLHNFPDYVLILAWQHQETIIKRLKNYLNKGGKIIIPLPKLRIIKNSL